MPVAWPYYYDCINLFLCSFCSLVDFEDPKMLKIPPYLLLLSVFISATVAMTYAELQNRCFLHVQMNSLKTIYCPGAANGKQG